MYHVSMDMDIQLSIYICNIKLFRSHRKTEAVLESLVSEARYEEALQLLEQSFIFYSAEANQVRE